MELINKNKKVLSIICIFFIVYARCDFGIVKNYGLIMNCFVVLISGAFGLMLMWSNKEEAKKSVLNIAILWLAIFLVFEFAYGHYGLVYDTKMYSIQYTLLTIIPALIVYEILWHNRENILDILSVAGSLVIIATFITNVKYDYLWPYVLKGDFYRLGEVPGGTVIDTGNLYMLMLIPVLYKLIVFRDFKRYLIPVIIGVIGILLTGSRSAAMPLVIIIVIMMLCTSKNKRVLKRNILIVVALMIVGLIAIMEVPILYEVLGSRFVEIFTNLDGAELDLKTSTGQRLAVLREFKNHFWEAPIFGHGFYAFKSMPYSQLEMYHENGETLFRNIQTHMNFLELLFSFGFVGFGLYYWYPVKLIVDSIKAKSKDNKILAISFLIAIFFMDTGLDMFYKYMTPFYVYLVVYILVGAKNSRKENTL